MKTKQKRAPPVGTGKAQSPRASPRVLVSAAAVLLILTVAASVLWAGSHRVIAYVRLMSAEINDRSPEELNNVILLSGYSKKTGEFIPVKVCRLRPLTVKDVVEALPGVRIIGCDGHDAYGCIHPDGGEPGETACGCADCDCTWKRERNADGAYAAVLNSLCYNEFLLTNRVETEEFGDGHGYGYGESWECCVSDSDSGALDFVRSMPMDEYIVSGKVYITLSFNARSFEW